MPDHLPWLPWKVIAAFALAAIAWCWYLNLSRPKPTTLTAPKPWPGSKETRFVAVYGAYLAAQVTEYIQAGRTPDLETMKVFVQEARAVAELAEEAE